MSGARVALVTGASSGIGAASATALAREGWDIAVHYGTNRSGAQEVADKVRACGRQAVLMQADMAQPDGPDRLFAAFDAAFPGIDALINNAGIVDAKAEVAQMDAARLNRMFAVNLTSPFLCAGHAVRRMTAGGVIVNISSAAARLGGAGQYVDYGASKAGIDLMTRALAEEVGPQGIRVVAIRPGIIETPIHEKGGDGARVQRITPMIPMRRPGSADEVAEAVVWLVSARASYVSGAILDVAGGR